MGLLTIAAGRTAIVPDRLLPMAQRRMGWVRRTAFAYGKVGVATYAGVWVSCFSAFFTALQADILAATDALKRVHGVAAAVDSGILRRFAATADEALGAVSPTAGNLALAWVLAKLCKPFRLLATAALTPRLARAWRRMPVR